MSWTVTIIDVRSMVNGQEAVCVLTNGADEKFQQSYQTNGTMADLMPKLQATIDAREAIKAKPELFVGQSFTIDATIAQATSDAKA